MTTIAVCLSGCGHLDGSEIHEAAQTLLALDQAGARALICAPNMPQATVTDHRTHKADAGGRRSVLAESARIARGEISDLAHVSAEDADALIFPGGFGAALNLCSFARDGAHCCVHPEVERIIEQMYDAGKPIGAICIAPALVARVLGRRRIPVRLTIGEDAATAAAIEKMGCRHQACKPGEYVLDEEHRIASTPAFMYGDSGFATVYEGIQLLVNAVVRMAEAHAGAGRR